MEKRTIIVVTIFASFVLLIVNDINTVNAFVDDESGLMSPEVKQYIFIIRR